MRFPGAHAGLPPELLERLAMDDAAFAAYLVGFAATLGRRAVPAGAVDRALRYPWARPASSYVLRDSAVLPLADAPDLRGRDPLVAFGSNAAPRALAAKLAHFPDAEDRAALVLTGALHGVDVGASASPAVYGALPAAVFASPGTAVRAAVLWVTPAQLTQLTWSELSYRVGHLACARFVGDDGDVLDAPLAYVSRIGALHLDGAPVALAAVPAEGRTARAMTQEQLLDAVAPLLLGPGTQAADVVHAVFDDMAGVVTQAQKTLWPLGHPLDAGGWTPPAPPTARSTPPAPPVRRP